MQEQQLSHPVSGTAARERGHSLHGVGTSRKVTTLGFGHGGVSKPAVRLREPRSRSFAKRAVPLEEQKALGKDA